MGGNKRIPSQGLKLENVSDWRVRGVHWMGMGSCSDKIVVLPDNVTHIGYEEKRIFESDCFDTQHIRSGWFIYHEPEPITLPEDIEEIHISASVKDISEKAFWRLPDDVKIFVDEENPYYEATQNNKSVRKKVKKD